MAVGGLGPRNMLAVIALKYFLPVVPVSTEADIHEETGGREDVLSARH